MATSPVLEQLHRLEAQLLLATLSGQVEGEDGDAGHPVLMPQLKTAEAAVHACIAGEYASALQAVLGTAGPGFDEAADSPVARAAAESLLNSARARAKRAADSQDGEGRAVEYAECLAAGAAALGLFVQRNVFGPTTKQHLQGGVEAAAASDVIAKCSNEQQQQIEAAGCGAAPSVTASSSAAGWLQRLSVDGEEVVGLLASPHLLLVAQALLLDPLGGLERHASADVRSSLEDAAAAATTASGGSCSAGWVGSALPVTWSWWALRCCVVHQRALVHPAASLWGVVERLIEEVTSVFGSGSTGIGGAAPPTQHLPLSCAAFRTTATCSLVEAALAQQCYGHVRESQALLRRAGEAAGLAVQLTGAMGKRTVHQLDAKAQLVVDMSRRGGEAGGGSPSSEERDQDEEAAMCCMSAVDIDAAGLATSGGSGQDSAGLDAVEDEPDVLPLPQLVDHQGRTLQEQEAGDRQRRLSLSEQALLLAWCMQVKRGTSADELQGWEMAPYVDAVLAQQATVPALRYAARLLRARHERTRSRTKARAMMSYEQLAEGLYQAQPGVVARSRYCHTVWFPLLPLLRKEAAEEMVACGLVGGALAVFEELQLWDSLITCYRLLGKKQQAEGLVRARLQVTPDDPKLWCALGDLQLDESCYHKAWEVSGHRSVRAQRSLARSAMGRKDFAAAGPCWEAALWVNPLHVEGWFSLGYCCLKGEDAKGAVAAFTRCCQLEPDHAEAWNNLAAVHMQTDQLDPAYWALGEALRYKRGMWRMWANYAQVAAKTGHWHQSVMACGKVLELTEGQQLPLDVLAMVTDHIAAVREGCTASPPVPAADGGEDGEEEDGEEYVAAVAAALSSSAFPSIANGSGGARTAAARAAASGEGDAASGVAPPGAAAAAAGAAGVVEGEERNQQTLERQAGQLLKAVAATPLANATFWRAFATYHRALGQRGSEHEALIKALRGLQVKGWELDKAAFQRVAAAVLDLCRATAQGAEQGEYSRRDVSSVRMTLNSAIKLSADEFEKEPLHEQMRGMLDRLKDMEKGLSASSS